MYEMLPPLEDDFPDDEARSSLMSTKKWLHLSHLTKRDRETSAST